MTTHGVQMHRVRYGIYRETALSYEEAVRRTVDELKSEGFGVLTEIDVRETLRKKLDVDFPRYVILGACNPPFAHRALTAEPDIGLLLPCNVVVHEDPSGRAGVSALRPTEVFGRLVDNPAMSRLAQEVEERLVRALDRVAASQA
jgi:uncharacterized protein (DUF302 family)